MVKRATAMLVAGISVVATGASCPEEISGPNCAETPFSVAGVNGDTTTTSTGLRFVQVDSLVGKGADADWCRTVIVHYTGYLLNGTQFDSSRDLAPLIVTPGTGALIDGFEQGVIGMRKCGIRRLIIPPALGFGSEPRRNQEGEIIVPANSTVLFDVEVLEIVGEPFVSCSEEPGA